MVVHLEENVSGRCLKQERRDPEIKNSVNGEDTKLDGDSFNFDDLLPSDPFGMEVSINLPNDFTIDFNISLPVDPFGMDFSIETTVSSVGDWIKDFGLQTSQKEKDRGTIEDGFEDDECVAKVNFSLPTPEEEIKNVVVDADSMMHEEDEASSDHKSLSSEMKDFMLFDCEKCEHDDRRSFSSDEEGSQVDGILFSLGYLSIKELFTVERICKRLNDAVRDNPPLWRNIAIGHPFSDLITDSALLKLTNRAQGTLHSLSLVKCPKITVSGLRHVLQANARLTKLNVAGCMKLTVGSVYETIKIFNSTAQPGIKKLRIGNLNGLTEQLFNDFKLLLGDNGKRQCENYKPRFFRDGEVYLSLEDERVIDIEICPRCQRPSQVYDCPAENCPAKINSTVCRACICCIPRCVHCGCCLVDRPYVETFFLEPLCIPCWTLTDMTWECLVSVCCHIQG